MQTTVTHYHVPLRFRQWSRKGYAVFAALKQHVTIGCLSKNVADTSLAKQTAVVCAYPNACTLFLHDEPEEVEEAHDSDLFVLVIPTEAACEQAVLSFISPNKPDEDALPVPLHPACCLFTLKYTQTCCTN